MNYNIGLLVLLGIALSVGSCGPSAISYSELVDYREGKTIYLKEGTWRIRRTLHLESGYTLVGYNTVLEVDDNFIYPVVSIEGKRNIILEGISIKGPQLKDMRNKATLAKYNYMHGVVLKDSDHIDFKNVTISNIKGSGVKATDCKYLDFIDCTFENIGVSTFQGTPYSSDGIYLGGYNYISNVNISNCTFRNISDFFEPGSPPWPNDGDGVHILTAGIAKDIDITNCTFEKCSARGVKIQSGININVRGCEFRSCRSGVVMPMLNQISNITIADNELYDTKISFGTDKAGAYMDALNVSILRNRVDKCDHFFRASGTSNLRGSNISDNVIDEVERFVIAGRLFSTEITNNEIKNYASSGDKSWNMAILLNKESKNVIIEDNIFVQLQGRERMLDDRSKKQITLRNNREE